MKKHSISLVLRKIRKKMNLSQKEISEKVGFCLATWNNWETGKTKPHHNSLRQISEKLNIELSELEVNTTTPSPTPEIPNIKNVDLEQSKERNRKEIFEIKIFSLWIVEFWENADEKERVWLKVQINKCFPDFKKIFD
ncbi:MAG: helix-turn-helix transcriptional regulator [Magnetococcales bacterium]|nr:helix-turn-helix transcriptional regulator [Magnetococcales bacterium]